MIYVSKEYIRAMMAPIKTIFLKLEIYKNDGTFIKEVSKQTSKDDVGSISVDTTRPVRRSFSFSLNNANNEFDWGDNKTIWINKHVRLYIGLKLRDGTVEYAPMGYFVLTELQDTHSMDGKRTIISGQDLMSYLTDKKGKFLNETTLAVGLNVGAAIKLIAQEGGISKFNFDAITETIPYTLTYQSGDSRYSAIEELSKLGKCSVYMDVNGYMRLKKIDLNEFDSLASEWSFTYGDPDERFYAGNVRKLDDGELANYIRVLGGSAQTASVLYDLVVDETNPLFADSPYSIQQLGKIIYFHNDGNPDYLIANLDDAKFRAKYELMNRLGYTESVSLSIAPHYLFEGNDVITLKDDENSIDGKYLIRSFSLPINPQLMTCECLKYKKIITNWDFL